MKFFFSLGMFFLCVSTFSLDKKIDFLIAFSCEIIVTLVKYILYCDSKALKIKYLIVATLSGRQHLLAKSYWAEEDKQN